MNGLVARQNAWGWHATRDIRRCHLCGDEIRKPARYWGVISRPETVTCFSCKTRGKAAAKVPA